METIDALEAVRRLTLERDALAKQLKDTNALMEKIKQSVLIDHLIPGGQDGLFHAVDWICFALRDEKKKRAAVMADRDALAEQVRRLEEQAATRIRERDDAVQRANHAENEAARLREENAPQAPERRERPETGTETTKDPNGAPRACDVPSWGKIARDVIWCASLALKNEIRLADARKDWDELRRLQKGKMALDRIRDELSNGDWEAKQ